MMNLYLIDADVKLREDWQNYAKAPKAPSNYKDTEKIEKYLEEKYAGLEDELLNNTFLTLDISKVRLVRYKPNSINSFDEDPLAVGQCDVFSCLCSDFRAGNSLLIIGDRGKQIIKWTLFNETAKSVVYSLQGEHERYYQMDKRAEILTGLNSVNVRFMTLNEFIFGYKECDLVLTNKFIPVNRSDYRDNLNYMRAVLKGFGFKPEDFKGMTYDLVNNKRYGN